MSEKKLQKNPIVQVYSSPAISATQQIAWQSLSPNTQRTYQQAYNQLEKWLAGRQLDDILLATYISDLDAASKSPATITLVMAAVRWGGKTMGIPFEFQLTELKLKTIRRQSYARGRGQVEGITWDEVEEMCAYAEAEGTVAGLRDSALIRLMSDCLLRISEAVAVNVSDVDRVLRVRQSKTDPDGRGATLYIGTPTPDMIRQYREAGQILGGALFRRVRCQRYICPGRLSADGARGAIKQRAKQAGIDGFISGHSLRVGSAISLAQAGAGIPDMQAVGRWKDSNMPARYASVQLAERSAIARLKYGKQN